MTRDLAAYRRILVIRLGALGDLVLSTGAFAAIRAAHPDARITLLTTSPYEALARECPWFDEIWVDPRPAVWNAAGWLGLRRRLRHGAFERVYDLQTSDRTGWYFRLLGPGARPEWSGIAPGCSHPDDNPDRRRIHTVERQRRQLARAGIEAVAEPDLSWLRGDVARFGVTMPYVLLIPGGSAHRPEKRWLAENYAALAADLARKGRTPVVIGGAAEAELGAAISAAAPATVDLAGRTSFAEIAALARGAEAAVGNDTGPMHLAAVAGARSLVLFSGASDPARTAPRGSAVTVLRSEPLGALPLAKVVAALNLI